MSTETPEWHGKMAEYAKAADGITTKTAGFFFVRHGETFYNDARVIQPIVGSRLNPSGRAQAEKAGKKLKDEKFEAYYASDMERAWETASIIAAHCGRQVHPNSDLHERDWGRWAGRSNEDLQWAASPENGETLEAFVRRTLRGLNEVLKNGDIAVVAHGGTFAVLLAAIGLPLRRPETFGARVVDNAAPIRVTPPNGAGSDWTVTPL